MTGRGRFTKQMRVGLRDTSEDIYVSSTSPGIIYNDLIIMGCRVPDVYGAQPGEPLFPIEERKVPASNLPGEHASPTQPFPVKPKPFASLSSQLSTTERFAKADALPFQSLFH